MKKLPIRPSRRLALGVILAASTFATIALAQLTSIGKSDVGFLAVGPAGLKIEGEGSGISVSEAGGKVKVAADLKTLKTGIDLRDKHLKKYLNVGTHPHAVLTVKRSALKFPADQKTVQSTTKGQMTINGKTHPTTFEYKAKRTGSDYHVQGMATIDYTKFIGQGKNNDEEICYLGACVDKQVKLKVKFKVRDK